MLQQNVNIKVKNLPGIFSAISMKKRVQVCLTELPGGGKKTLHETYKVYGYEAPALFMSIRLSNDRIWLKTIWYSKQFALSYVFLTLSEQRSIFEMCLINAQIHIHDRVVLTKTRLNQQILWTFVNIGVAWQTGWDTSTTSLSISQNEKIF